MTKSLTKARAPRARRSAAIAMSGLLTASIVLSACTPNTQGLMTSLGASDPGDPCATEVNSMRSNGDFFNAVLGSVANSMIENIGVSLLSGGGISAGSLAQSAGNAALQASGSYFKQLASAQGSSSAMSSTLISDARTENQNIEKSILAFQGVRACRMQETDRIRSAFGRGELTRDKAQSLLAEERTRYQRDVRYARSVGTKVDERNAELLYASAQIAEDDPQAAARYRQLAAASQSARQSSTGYNFGRATSGTNIRAKASGSSSRVGFLDAGKDVQIIGTQSGWSKVALAGGKSGYILSKLLTPSNGSKLASNTGIASGNEVSKALAGINRSKSSDPEVEQVAVVYEGVEKSIDYNRMTNTQADQDLDSQFGLDS